MAPSVLGIGVPASSSIVPEDRRAGLEKMLIKMDADMNASPYDWEMLWFNPEDSFDILKEKLRQKDWDCVAVGVGIRMTTSITPFFEEIINVVHEELPKCKFAFPATLDGFPDACGRVLKQ